MKTVLKILFAYVSLALMTACSWSDHDPKPAVTNVHHEDLLLVAEVVCTPFDVCDGNCIQLCGTSTFCCLTDKTPIVKISGEIKNLDSKGDFEFSNGKVEINILGTESYLVGVFRESVTGHKDESGVNLTGKLIIQNGLGVFDAQGGEVLITINGEKISVGSLVKMKYEFLLQGFLEKTDYVTSL